MAILIVEHAGRRMSLPLSGQIWIGRDPACQVVINHPVVSRRHASVQPVGPAAARVADHGSRNGVMIAGQRVVAPRDLRDGDIFQIGPASFQFRAGDEGIDVAAPSVDEGETGGIVFACDCGARLWAPRGFGGSSTICPQCGRRVVCPLHPPERRINHAPASDTLQMTLPDDALPTPGTPMSFPAENAPPHEPNVEVPLLICAALGTLLGLVSYGLPAAIVLFVSLGYLMVRQGRRRAMLVLAALISFGGAIAGVLSSLHRWMGLSPQDLIGR